MTLKYTTFRKASLLEQFWSKISWSSANFIQSLLWLQHLSEAKVSELDIEVLVKEDIFGLDVSVNHPSPVTVLQRFCHLFAYRQLLQRDLVSGRQIRC